MDGHTHTSKEGHTQTDEQEGKKKHANKHTLTDKYTAR